jgi:hypothetical protein
MVKIGLLESSLIGNKFAQSGHTAGKVEQINLAKSCLANSLQCKNALNYFLPGEFAIFMVWWKRPNKPLTAGNK